MDTGLRLHLAADRSRRPLSLKANVIFSWLAALLAGGALGWIARGAFL